MGRGTKRYSSSSSEEFSDDEPNRKSPRIEEPTESDVDTHTEEEIGAEEESVQEESDQEVVSPEPSDDEEEDNEINLNIQQKGAANYVLKLINDREYYRNNLTAVCIQGAAGTGKTEVLKYLCDRVEANGGTAIFTAASGVSASKRDEGRTAHSMFGLPWRASQYNNEHSNISSFKENEIRKACLIVCDEVNMLNKRFIAMLDRTLRSFMGRPKQMFGGKIMVFAGDFCQVTPIDREEDASIRSLALWRSMQIFELTELLRTRLDPEYGYFLDRMRSRRLPALRLNDENKLYIPLNKINYTTQVDDLINFVYPESIINDPDLCAKRAILTPRRQDARVMNHRIFSRMVGPSVTCHAHNKNYRDFFDLLKNDVKIDKVVPNKALKLKKGCLCTVIRNVYKPITLIVGSTVIVEDIFDDSVQIRKPGETDLYMLSREYFQDYKSAFDQFPLELYYARTIHKGQGQTFDKVGLDLLGDEVQGSYEELYMAMSRVRSQQHIKVLVDPVHVVKGTAYAAATVFEEL